jgi:hypothetical protein
VKTRWLGKNIDLNKLQHFVEDFFRKKGFSLFTEKSGNVVMILTKGKYGENFISLTVKIEGNPMDFYVELISKDVPAWLTSFSFFLNYLGLGYFYSKKIDMLAVYKALEEEFWNYLDEVVDKCKE